MNVDVSEVSRFYYNVTPSASKLAEGTNDQVERTPLLQQIVFIDAFFGVLSVRHLLVVTWSWHVLVLASVAQLTSWKVRALACVLLRLSDGICLCVLVCGDPAAGPA